MPDSVCIYIQTRLSLMVLVWMENIYIRNMQMIVHKPSVLLVYMYNNHLLQEGKENTILCNKGNFVCISSILHKYILTILHSEGFDVLENIEV